MVGMVRELVADRVRERLGSVGLKENKSDMENGTCQHRGSSFCLQGEARSSQGTRDDENRGKESYGNEKRAHSDGN